MSRIWLRVRGCFVGGGGGVCGGAGDINDVEEGDWLG